MIVSEIDLLELQEFLEEEFIIVQKAHLLGAIARIENERKNPYPANGFERDDWNEAWQYMDNNMQKYEG